MATLTITVPPDLLERAKKSAMARNTTVEQLLEESLVTIAGETGSADFRVRQTLAIAALRRWAEEHPFSSSPGSYTREELHERG